MNTPLAEAAWITVTIDRLFRPLRLVVGLDQPAPVPAPERTARLREVQRVAVGKVGGDVRFLGAAVVLAIASAA